MRAAALLLLAAWAAPAEWKESRSGPFIVYSDAGDEAARMALYHLEQFRFLYGEALGLRDLKTVWPVTVVVQKPGQAEPFFGFGRTGWTGWWPARSAPQPSFFRQLALVFLEDNLKGRIPGGFEPAIASLYSTLRLEKNRALVGDPPPPPEQTPAWALLHRLLTAEETSARTRIVLANLVSGADIETAFRNAFERPMNGFPAGPGGAPIALMPRPMNPSVVFTLTPTLYSRARLLPGDLLLARGAPPAQVRAAYEKAQAERPGAGGFEGLGLALLALGDPAAARKALEQMAADEDNSGPRGLFELARLQTGADARRLLLERASKKLPSWHAPYAELAATEPGPVRRAYWLQKAVELKPRDSALWAALARAQFEAADYPAAEKSWRAAERVAQSESAAAEIRAARERFEQERIERQNAARRQAAEEEKAELDRLREQTLESIRRAEAKANQGASLEGKKIEKWWDGPAAQSFSGTLDSVECRAGRIRLVLKDPAGKPFWLRVPDPSQVVVTGAAGAHAELKCGPQNPARRVAVQFTPPDTAVAIEFQ